MSLKRPFSKIETNSKIKDDKQTQTKEQKIEQFKKLVCSKPECVKYWEDLKFSKKGGEEMQDFTLDCEESPSNVDTYAIYHCDCHNIFLYGKNDCECDDCGLIMCEGCSTKQLFYNDDTCEYYCKDCVEQNKKPPFKIVFTALSCMAGSVAGLTQVYDSKDKSVKNVSNLEITKSPESLCDFIESAQEESQEQSEENLVVVLADNHQQITALNDILKQKYPTSFPKTPLSQKYMSVIDIISFNRAQLGLKGIYAKPWEHDISPIIYYEKNTPLNVNCQRIASSFVKYIKKHVDVKNE